MAIFTFSTKTRKPEDTKTVEDVKAHCLKTNKNFSGILVDLLRQYKETLND